MQVLAIACRLGGARSLADGCYLYILYVKAKTIHAKINAMVRYVKMLTVILHADVHIHVGA